MSLWQWMKTAAPSLSVANLSERKVYRSPMSQKESPLRALRNAKGSQCGGPFFPLKKRRRLTIHPKQYKIVP